MGYDSETDYLWDWKAHFKYLKLNIAIFLIPRVYWHLTLASAPKSDADY